MTAHFSPDRRAPARSLPKCAGWLQTLTGAGLLALFALLPLLACCGSAAAAEAGMKNVYDKVRFRLFRKDRFLSEIVAEKAEATQVDQQDPVVKMTGVAIDIYDSAGASDERPPLKARITSDKGTYMRAADPATGELQEIAILEGNVVVYRYLKLAPGSEKPELESTILCDDARWNNSTGVLNGAGKVTMFREDGTLRLTGTGMIYQIDKTKPEKADLDTQAGDLSGILELQRTVRMEIRTRRPDGKADPASLTVVTSQGRARYDLDKRDMRFWQQVAVQRNNMQILCDQLRVLLAEKDSASQKFREMFAESTPTGMVDIRGKGNPNDPANRSLGDWRGQARYVKYVEEAGELYLTDNRPDFLPMAQLENHIIRNTAIQFLIKEQSLLASGRFGETVLNSEEGLSAPAPGAAQKDEKIVIRYTDRLIFDKAKNFARFTGDVRLTSSGLQMDSEKLLVDFTPEAAAGAAGAVGSTPEVSAGRVSKVTASDNVRLLYQQRRAKCAVLEITPNLDRTATPDSKGYLLVDQFIMSGTPLPEIEIPGGGYFQARLITTTRLRRLTSDKKIVLINAAGPGSGLFGGAAGETAVGTSPAPGATPGVADATAIRYSDRMIYDEAKDTVTFTGDVTATKADQVLRSDRLEAWLVSAPGSEDKERKEIQRLVASSNASMHWGLRHAEADTVDRLIPQNGRKDNDIVTLTGRADKPARIWEENGAAFRGQNITAAADGSWVRSRGRGELSMLDRETNEPAMVMYSGEAYYGLKAGGDSFAIFDKDVILKRGTMTVRGDRMRADMVLVKGAGGRAPEQTPLTAEGTSSANLPRKLKRVIIESNVVIQQGKRVAYGSRGQVDVNDDGDVMVLEGNQKQRAEVRDNSGFQLFAPRVMVKEQAGIITAAGPGEVRISGMNSAKDAGVDTGAMGGVKGRDQYVITYGGSLLYNMLLRKIRFQDNVRMTQDTLSGACQTMTVFLNKPSGAGGEDAPMKVEYAEASGDVRFIRLSEPAAGRQLADMPGTTVLTRSDEVQYSPAENKILLSNTRPGTKPAIRVQESMGGRRMRITQRASRIWVDTVKGVYETSNDQVTDPGTGTEGPLTFPEDR